MNRTIRWYDYITVNIYHLGLSALSQTLAPLVIPLLVQGIGRAASVDQLTLSVVRSILYVEPLAASAGPPQRSVIAVMSSSPQPEFCVDPPEDTETSVMLI